MLTGVPLQAVALTAGAELCARASHIHSQGLLTELFLERVEARFAPILHETVEGKAARAYWMSVAEKLGLDCTNPYGVYISLREEIDNLRLAVAGGGDAEKAAMFALAVYTVG